MKTHKCRPLLIENKDTPNKQLILISLEDEKIEVGDKFYDEESKTIETSFGIMNGLIIVKENSNVGCNPDFCSKVIATQEQMPPEYIQFQSVFDKLHIKPIIYTEGDTKKYLEIIRRFKNHCNDTSWPSESFRKKVIKVLEKK